MFSAGWQGLFAIEKNLDAFSTLKHNLISPNVTGYRSDWPEWLRQEAMEVSGLPAKHKDKLVSLRGRVDLIAGGPPCQGFSTAGKRDPDDPRNSLTEEYIQVVKLVQSRFLLIENVRGFNSAFKEQGKPGKKEKPYFLFVRGKLESLGYSVSSALVCCSHFGVPQYRKRFIMLAILDGDPLLQILVDEENGATCRLIFVLLYSVERWFFF